MLHHAGVPRVENAMANLPAPHIPSEIWYFAHDNEILKVCVCTEAWAIGNGIRYTFVQGQSHTVSALNELKDALREYTEAKARLGLAADRSLSLVSDTLADEVFVKQAEYWTKRVCACVGWAWVWDPC